MARSYARVVTAIWRNAEFRALNSSAQRTYILLVTQPNITAAGTLPLTIRRWSEMASDTSIEDIKWDLQTLSAGRFIGVDFVTEEVLVRSFVRHDGGYGNRKRRPVIISAAAEVVSEGLRMMLTAELNRLGVPFDAGTQTASHGERDATDSLSFGQVDSLSDSASGTHGDTQTQFDRVVGCQGELIDATTHNPQPFPPSAGATKSGKVANKVAQELTRIYVDLVPLSNFPAVMGVVKKARSSGRYDDEQIRGALERLGHDGRSVTTDTLRYELDGIPAGGKTALATIAGGRASTTDQRVMDAQRLKALYDPGGAA